MPAMNTKTAGVVDPILSKYARGYRNAEMIGHLLFPRVTIPNRNMQVIRFGKDSFRMMNTRRAPGSQKKRIQYGFGAEPISLVQEALEGIVPFEHQEEAAKEPGIDMAQGALNKVLDVIDLGLEFEISEMARNAASYGANNKVTLSGNQRWTDAASDPEGDMDGAKEAIRQMIGRYPNTLTLGPSVATALKRHPKIKEQFKYTSLRSITTEMLAGFFEVERVIVGKAVYLPETAGDDQPARDVWGDDAILSYVPLDGATYDVPAYGYTYELEGYPQVNTPYVENATDSWIYPFKTERRPYLVGVEGGFLLKNAGAK